jgi:hypothetical protein
MKINTTPQQETQVQQVDLASLFQEYQEKYKQVFIHQIEGQIFMYRALGRSEYKKIAANTNLNEFQKEEVICELCTLWPESYDFENCEEAGIPTTLCSVILKNSCMDSIDTRKQVMDYYRQEMFDLDNQINCIINEAFPQLDIEDIERWGVERTSKYLAAAEWKMVNLRGANITFDPMEVLPQQQQPTQPQQLQQPQQKPDVTVTGKKREKLTPEKLAELKRKFPEIDWEHDAAAVNGMDAFGESEAVDTTSPALRPGW